MEAPAAASSLRDPFMHTFEDIISYFYLKESFLSYMEMKIVALLAFRP